MAEAKIKWHAVFGSPNGNIKVPLEKGMQPHGYEASCNTCGWETKTGGAIKAEVKRRIDDHKWDHSYESNKAGSSQPAPTTLGRQFD
jgi:hypothetical protein